MDLGFTNSITKSRIENASVEGLRGIRNKSGTMTGAHAAHFHFRSRVFLCDNVYLFFNERLRSYHKIYKNINIYI